jgi:glycosyltransferase involved in cell wall biosynthesis
MRLLLLAPVGVPGGISTWASVFRAHTRHDVTTLDTARRYLALGARRPARRAVLGALTAVQRLVRCVRMVAREKPDAVYITCAPSLGLWLRDFPLLFILGRLGVPTLVHLHGGSIAGFFGSGRSMRWLSTRAFRRAQAVIVITRPVQDAAQELLGAGRVHFVPNMLPDDYAGEPTADRPGAPSADLVALHVAFQAREKGTLEVLELASRLPHLRFRLVGAVPPDFQPTVEASVEALAVRDRVRFTGALRGDALAVAYSRADLMVLPSHAEGFPMVVLEAMAHGLPVVASDVGAIAEVVGAETDAPAGFVLPTNPVDLDQMVDRIEQLASSPELRAALGANGRRRVARHYSASAVAPAVDDLVESVAAEARAR